MPNFELVGVAEAIQRTTRSTRNAAAQEYIAFVNQVGPDQAGKLTPSNGETVLMVRRRVNAAAKMLSRDLKIVRTDDEVYFWNAAPTRRRGRPRRAS